MNKEQIKQVNKNDYSGISMMPDKEFADSFKNAVQMFYGRNLDEEPENPGQEEARKIAQTSYDAIKTILDQGHVEYKGVKALVENAVDINEVVGQRLSTLPLFQMMGADPSPIIGTALTFNAMEVHQLEAARRLAIAGASTENVDFTEEGKSRTPVEALSIMLENSSENREHLLGAFKHSLESDEEVLYKANIK